jgi:hypothetical protein
MRFPKQNGILSPATSAILSTILLLWLPAIKIIYFTYLMDLSYYALSIQRRMGGKWKEAAS